MASVVKMRHLLLGRLEAAVFSQGVKALLLILEFRTPSQGRESSRPLRGSEFQFQLECLQASVTLIKLGDQAAV